MFVLPAAALSTELSDLKFEVSKLISEQSAHQAHMDSLDNLALKTRFLAKLHDISSAIKEKENKVRRFECCKL